MQVTSFIQEVVAWDLKLLASFFHIMVGAMLSLKKTQFSPALYYLYRKHVVQSIIKIAFLMTVSGAAAIIFLFLFLRKDGDVRAAGFFIAVFLFLAWSSHQSIRELLRVRVVPYFERPLGRNDTSLAGEHYLRHSLRLDEIATQIGVRPLSEFASGDDLIDGEGVQWFSPDDALHTIESLLRHDVSSDLSTDVISDVTHIRDALRLASSQGVKFCLLLRHGTSVSGLELDRRKGSFF